MITVVGQFLGRCGTVEVTPISIPTEAAPHLTQISCSALPGRVDFPQYKGDHHDMWSRYNKLRIFCLALSLVAYWFDVN